MNVFEQHIGDLQVRVWATDEGIIYSISYNDQVLEQNFLYDLLTRRSPLCHLSKGKEYRFYDC